MFQLKAYIAGKENKNEKKTIELNDRDYRKYKKEQEKIKDDLLILYEVFFDGDD